MFLFLLIIWFIFVGSLTVKNLIIGIIVSGLLTLFCSRFMGYSTKGFVKWLGKAGKTFAYLAFLLKEIFVSNIAVLRFIYSKKEPQPELVHFKPGLKTEKARVVLANSITLTPGTYTTGLEGDEFTVHALDRSFADSIEDCSFAKKCRDLEA